MRKDKNEKKKKKKTKEIKMIGVYVVCNERV